MSKESKEELMKKLEEITSIIKNADDEDEAREFSRAVMSKAEDLTDYVDDTYYDSYDDSY